MATLLQELGLVSLDAENEDSLPWIEQRNGVFSVQSCNKNFVAAENFPSWPWRINWGAKTPYKVICFSWILADDGYFEVFGHLWHLIFNIFGKKWVILATSKNLLCSWMYFKGNKKLKIIQRAIWRARNLRCFAGQEIPIQVLKFKYPCNLATWCNLENMYDDGRPLDFIDS